jgi:hypothetical protein
MARITRWSNVFEVQREQARLSNNEDWNNKHFWNEFIVSSAGPNGVLASSYSIEIAQGVLFDTAHIG